MLNLNELESRWIKYKIKYYIPHAIIFFSLIIIIVLLSIIDFAKEKNLPTTDLVIPKTIEPMKLKKEVTQVSKIENKPLVVKKELPKQTITIEQNEETKMTIAPSLDFIKTMQGNAPKYYNEIIPQASYVPKKRSIKKKEKKLKEKVLVVEKPKVEIVQNNLIAIKRQNTQEDIQHVIKRFKRSNNPALSLFIAKKYYELGKYSQSYNYALLTNEINNDIEESWIIFSKSLVKLKNKEKAISILEEYIKVSHSSRATILLNNIKSGKIK